MDKQRNEFSNYNPQQCAEAGGELIVVDPLGRETDWKINLMGADSDSYMETFRKIQRRQGKELERAKKYRVQSPEQMLEDGIELLVAVTTGWNDKVSLAAGQTFPFSKDNARRLYRERPDIREQADAYITDRANFLQNSATS